MSVFDEGCNRQVAEQTLKRKEQFLLECGLLQLVPRVSYINSGREFFTSRDSLPEDWE
jgi:hypothetical protein